MEMLVSGNAARCCHRNQSGGRISEKKRWETGDKVLENGKEDDQSMTPWGWMVIGGCQHIDKLTTIEHYIGRRYHRFFSRKTFENR